MDNHDEKQIRIQILDAKEEAGSVAGAVCAVRDRVQDLAALGREQGAVALLICPAVEAFIDEGFSVVIGARFGHELDDETVFWRQRSLADAMHDKLNVDALVLDLDLSLDGYVKSIEGMLAIPFRNELGMLTPLELADM